jgi:hypothetical protein
MRRLRDALMTLMGLGPVTVAFTPQDEALARKVARRWANHYFNDDGAKTNEEMQADLEIDILLAIKEFSESDRHRREAQRLRDRAKGKALDYEEAYLL